MKAKLPDTVAAPGSGHKVGLRAVFSARPALPGVFFTLLVPHRPTRGGGGPVGSAAPSLPRRASPPTLPQHDAAEPRNGRRSAAPPLPFPGEPLLHASPARRRGATEQPAASLPLLAWMPRATGAAHARGHQRSEAPSDPAELPWRASSCSFLSLASGFLRVLVTLLPALLSLQFARQCRSIVRCFSVDDKSKIKFTSYDKNR